MNIAELNKAVSGASTASSKEPMPASIAALASLMSQVTAPSPVQNNAGVVFPSNGNQTRSIMNQLCADIKAERMNQGMTQRDLAHKCGMSQGTITRAERHGWISIWALLRIVDALGKKIQLT